MPSRHFRSKHAGSRGGSVPRDVLGRRGYKVKRRAGRCATSLATMSWTLQRYELHGAGVPIKLRRKVFQVLAYLLAHRDRVVPKQELLEHLWPDQFVGDATLKSCITALRKALGERRTHAALPAHAARPGLSLCGGGRGAGAPPGGHCAARPRPARGTGGGQRERGGDRQPCPSVPAAPEGALALHEAPSPLAMPWTGNTNRSPCSAGPWPRRLPWRRAWGRRRCTT